MALLPPGTPTAETSVRSGRDGTAHILSGDFAGTTDFTTLITAAVSTMASMCEVRTWLVTRVVDDDWIILAAHDPVYGLEAGDVLTWSESVCSRMVRGLGPTVVADIKAEPVYAAAPIVQKQPISCYIGMPLLVEGEHLFGTLCGIGPEVQDNAAALVAKQPMFEFVTKAIASALAADLELDRSQRKLELALSDATTDALTGLGNRRAWDTALVAEEERCRRYGHSAAVFVVDLNDLKILNDQEGHSAGDELIRRTATALADAVREVDQVFRIGGDEFTILAPEVGAAGRDAVERRVRNALLHNGIEAAIGSSLRSPLKGLQAAFDRADEAMYEDKPS